MVKLDSSFSWDMFDTSYIFIELSLFLSGYWKVCQIWFIKCTLRFTTFTGLSLFWPARK